MVCGVPGHAVRVDACDRFRLGPRVLESAARGCSWPGWVTVVARALGPAPDARPLAVLVPMRVHWRLHPRVHQGGPRLLAGTRRARVARSAGQCSITRQRPALQCGQFVISMADTRRMKARASSLAFGLAQAAPAGHGRSGDRGISLTSGRSVRRSPWRRDMPGSTSPARPMCFSIRTRPTCCSRAATSARSSKCSVTPT